MHFDLIQIAQSILLIFFVFRLAVWTLEREGEQDPYVQNGLLALAHAHRTLLRAGAHLHQHLWRWLRLLLRVLLRMLRVLLVLLWLLLRATLLRYATKHAWRSSRTKRGT